MGHTIRKGLQRSGGPDQAERRSGKAPALPLSLAFTVADDEEDTGDSVDVAALAAPAERTSGGRMSIGSPSRPAAMRERVISVCAVLPRPISCNKERHDG